jgi:hypothetical protein
MEYFAMKKYIFYLYNFAVFPRNEIMYEKRPRIIFNCFRFLQEWNNDTNNTYYIEWSKKKKKMLRRGKT